MSSAKRQNEASGASSFSNVFLLLFITFHCSVSVTTEKSSGSKDDSIRLLLSDNGRRGGTADWPTIRLMRLRSVSQPPVTLQTVSPEFQAEVYVTSSSFAYSYWEKTLFFVDQDDNIRFTKIEANEEKKLVTNMVHERVLDETVSSLSVDWVTNKIFWFISTSPARLEVSDFEGNIWRVLLSDDPDVEMVTGMAVDPHQGYVYFLNGGHKRLDRVWMDGSHLSTLLHLSSKDGQASSRLPATLLRLDMSSGLLYWVERGRIVRRCNSSNGENLETVFSGHADLRQIDIYEGYLYMLTFGDRIGNRKLYRKCISADPNICPVPSDNDTATELLERQQAEDFMIFEPEIQPQHFLHNPCALKNGNCSHLCLRVPEAPYRKCACPTGVKLFDDRLTCADRFEKLLVVATRSHIIQISMDTEDHIPMQLPVREDAIQDAVALDYDYGSARVLYSDNQLMKIASVPLESGGDRKLAISDLIKTSFDISDGLAIDHIARNIYWTDSGLDRIEVARLDDGSIRRILISSDLKHPRGIAVDPIGGHLYFSDWQEDQPRIETTFLDGSSRRILISFEQHTYPNCITLDPGGRRLYYVLVQIGVNEARIESANTLDGSGQQALVKQRLRHPFGIALMDGWVYWTDWNRRFLERIRTDGTQRSKLKHDVDGAMGVAAIDRTRRSFGTNDCAKENGGCSHLCFYRPTGKLCQCPLGMELSTSDNSTCVVPEAYLLFTQNGVTDLLRVSVTRTYGNVDRLGLTNSASMDQGNRTQPVALDFDFSDARLYWSSGLQKDQDDHGTISTAFLNGTQPKILVNTGLRYVEGVSMDWVSRQLYFSEWHYGRIEVVAVDKPRVRSVLIYEQIAPRSIAADPTHGYIYFANWRTERGSIDRAEMDGNNRQELIRNSGRVTSLSIDNKRIYWSTTDANPGLFSADLSGAARRNILQQSSMRPLAMTHFEGRIYWADYISGKIESADALTGENRVVVHNKLHHLQKLIAVHPLKHKGWNQCATARKTCEHFCFAKPNHPELYGKHSSSRGNGYRCGCPTHYTLDDKNGRTCSSPKAFVLAIDGESGVIYRWKLNGEDRTTLGRQTNQLFEGTYSSLKFKSFKGAVKLQYDAITETIYWLARKQPKVHQLVRRRSPVEFRRNRKKKVERILMAASLNGSAVRAVPLEGRRCDAYSFAVDAIGRQLLIACRRGRLVGNDGSGRRRSGNGGKQQETAIRAYRLSPLGATETQPLRYLGDFVEYGISTKGRRLPPKDMIVLPRQRLLFFVEEDYSSGKYRIVLCKMTSDRWRCNRRWYEDETVMTKRRDQNVVLEADTFREDLIWNDGVLTKVANTQWPKAHYDADFGRRSHTGPIAYVGDDFGGDYLLFQDVGNGRLLARAREPAAKGDPSVLSVVVKQLSGQQRLQLKKITALLAVNWQDIAGIDDSPCLTKKCSHACLLYKPKSTKTAEASSSNAKPDIELISSSSKGSGRRRLLDIASYYARCSCPLDMHLAKDERRCVENVRCDATQMNCLDGQTCVHRRRRCNGQNDCPDGDDERDCQRCAAGDQWMCDDGAGCILRDKFCDGVYDCADKSDETGCTCATMFDCDGWRQTPDTVSKRRPLSPQHRRVAVAHCINRTLLCDDRVDCANGADEKESVCSGRLTSKNGGISQDTSADVRKNSWLPRDGPGAIVFWVVSMLTLLLLTVVICLSICFCWRRQFARGNRSETEITAEIIPLHGRRLGGDGSRSTYPTGAGNSSAAPFETRVVVRNVIGGNGRLSPRPPPPPPVLPAPFSSDHSAGTGGSHQRHARDYPRSRLTGKSSSSGDARNRWPYAVQTLPGPSWRTYYVDDGGSGEPSSIAMAPPPTEADSYSCSGFPVMRIRTMPPAIHGGQHHYRQGRRHQHSKRHPIGGASGGTKRRRKRRRTPQQAAATTYDDEHDELLLQTGAPERTAVYPVTPPPPYSRTHGHPAYGSSSGVLDDDGVGRRYAMPPNSRAPDDEDGTEEDEGVAAAALSVPSASSSGNSDYCRETPMFVGYQNPPPSPRQGSLDS